MGFVHAQSVGGVIRCVPVGLAELEVVPFLLAAVRAELAAGIDSVRFSHFVFVETTLCAALLGSEGGGRRLGRGEKWSGGERGGFKSSGEVIEGEREGQRCEWDAGGTFSSHRNGDMMLSPKPRGGLGLSGYRSDP